MSSHRLKKDITKTHSSKDPTQNRDVTRSPKEPRKTGASSGVTRSPNNPRKTGASSDVTRSPKEPQKTGASFSTDKSLKKSRTNEVPPQKPSDSSKTQTRDKEDRRRHIDKKESGAASQKPHPLTKSHTIEDTPDVKEEVEEDIPQVYTPTLTEYPSSSYLMEITGYSINIVYVSCQNCIVVLLTTVYII